MLAMRSRKHGISDENKLGPQYHSSRGLVQMPAFLRVPFLSFKFKA